MNDHKDVALVFDMRSQNAFNEMNLSKSVNISIDQFKEDSFVQWNKVSKQLEGSSSVFKNKY